VDGDGNIIDDKKIVEEVEEPCDPEVCKSAIKKKTEKHHEDKNNTNVDAVNASKDAMPSDELEVVFTEALLEEPPKHHGRKSIQSKKNCHANHQYRKLPKFNYNYKVSDAYIFYAFVLD
jgi:hypothetical protein